MKPEHRPRVISMAFFVLQMCCITRVMTPAPMFSECDSSKFNINSLWKEIRIVSIDFALLKITVIHLAQSDAISRPIPFFDKLNILDPTSLIDLAPAKFCSMFSNVFCTMTSESMEMPPNLSKLVNRKKSEVCATKYSDSKRRFRFIHCWNGVPAAYVHKCTFRKKTFEYAFNACTDGEWKFESLPKPTGDANNTKMSQFGFTLAADSMVHACL